MFLAVMALALLALLPMRLVLGWVGVADKGVSARAISGSIWSGRLQGARVGRVELGDLSARLSPFALLLGKADLSVSGGADGGGARLSGDIAFSRSALDLRSVSATLPVSGVFDPLPVTSLDLDGLDIRFEDGRCMSASGRVKASLGGGIGGLRLGDGFSGEARCDADALVLPLLSRAGTESVSIRVEQSGHFRAAVMVQPNDPGAAEPLLRSGFRAGPGGYVLPIEGRL